MRIAFAALLLAACALPALAERDEDMHEWMEQSEKAMAVLKKMNLESNPKPAILAAERLGVVYENMIGFWRQRNSAKAVDLSIQGKAIALQLVQAVYAKDTAKAQSAFKALGDTCTPCHQVHRERLPDGKYRMK